MTSDDLLASDKVMKIYRVVVFTALSALGYIFLFYSLLRLENPSIWALVLVLTFTSSALTFAPVVRLKQAQFTLASIITMFVIMDVSMWAAIWISCVEIVTLSIVGGLRISRVALNMGQMALTIIATGFVWSLLEPYSEIAGAIACGFTYFLLNSLLTGALLMALLRKPLTVIIRGMWRDTALSFLSLLMLGSTGALLYRSEGWGAALIVLVLYFFIRSMLKQKVEDSATIQSYADQLQLRYISSIQSLARAIDARDPYTFGHSMRVAEMSRRLARVHAPHLDEEDVYFGGLLHDVGKIALPDSILLKPGRLEPDELAKMMQHPLMGLEILRGSGLSELILQIVRSHHEWTAGGGYPDNVSREEFPIAARIVGIVDAFDAMVSNRPYRRGCSIPEAVDRLLKAKGEQFDGAALDSFLDMLYAIPVDELAQIGYGDQPPNQHISPVAELPDVTQTLAERFQVLLRDVTFQRSRLTESEEQAPGQLNDNNEEAIITAEIVRRLGSVLSDSAGISSLTSHEILERLGVTVLVGVGARQASAAQEVPQGASREGATAVSFGTRASDIDRVRVEDKTEEPRKRLRD